MIDGFAFLVHLTLRLAFKRELNNHHRTFPNFAFNPNRTIIAVNNLLSYKKPESCCIVTGGKKRIKYPVQIFFRDTRAGVFNRNSDMILFNPAFPGFDDKGAPCFFHGVNGIVDEVQHHLLKF